MSAQVPAPRTGQAGFDPAFANYLQQSGHGVWWLDGIAWHAYNGFIMPACLPHRVPGIEAAQAQRARRVAGVPFARWISDFQVEPPAGSAGASAWWYVNRTGPYGMEQLSGNTRSKLRRGLKRLQVRPLTVAEVLRHGHGVCRAAVARYGTGAFLPAPEQFRRRVEAAAGFPETVEYYGVLAGDRLLGFSENYLQAGAVFWESIWYDPEGLKDYASYALTHGMLDHYLNERGLAYVTDGSRSLYHDTRVQEFFVEKFGFHHAPARLHVSYSPWFGTLVAAANPFASVIGALARRRVPGMAKAAGLLRQHRIARGGQASLAAAAAAAGGGG